MLLWRRPRGLDVGEGLPPGAFGEHPCRFIAQRPQPEKAKDVFLIVFFSFSARWLSGGRPRAGRCHGDAARTGELQVATRRFLLKLGRKRVSPPLPAIRV